MKLLIAFASLLAVLLGVIQGAFDLDGNIENIGRREVIPPAASLIPLDLRGIAFSQSSTDDCTESKTLLRTTSNKGTAPVLSTTEIYPHTSPVPSSSAQATTTFTTSWGPYIYSQSSPTSTSHRPASSSSSKVSINSYPKSSSTSSAHGVTTSPSSTESYSEVSTLASSSTVQVSHSSSTSHGVHSSAYASSQLKTFGPSSTESCIETSSILSVSSPTHRSHTTRSSRKHSTSRTSTKHTTKPSDRTSSTSTTQAVVTFSSLTSYPGTSTSVISSTHAVPISLSSTENCTESSTSPVTSTTAQGIATSSSSITGYPVSYSSSTSHGITTSSISAESCDETSIPASSNSQSFPSISSNTSSAVTIYSTITASAESVQTVLSGVIYTYSTTTVHSTVISTAQTSSSTSTECNETTNPLSSGYQSSNPSSTSANAGEFTVLTSQSSPTTLVNVSNIPRSTASSIISLAKPSLLPSKGRSPLADEPYVASTTTENILSTSTVLSSSTVLVLATITVLPTPQTVAALATPSRVEMISHEVTVGITSTFTSMSTVVEFTTIIVPPQSSFAFTESQPQNPSTAASQVPSLTSSPPTIFTAGPGPLCNGDNCLNELNRFNTSAIPFCLTYTTTINTNPAAIPTYLENCNLSTQAISSACSCMISSSSRAPTAFLPSPSTTSKVLKNASPTLTETIIVSNPAGIVALNQASSSPQGIPPITLPGAAASPLGGSPTLNSYSASFSTYNTDTTLQTFLTPGAKPPVSYTTPESANTLSLSTTAVGPSPLNTSGLYGNAQPTPVFPWMGSGQSPPPVGTGTPLVISPVGNITTTSGSPGVYMGGVKLFALLVGFFALAMLS